MFLGKVILINKWFADEKNSTVGVDNSSYQMVKFINTVSKDLKRRRIPVVDVEYYGDKEQILSEKTDVVRELKTYMETLEREYGVKQLIYMINT